MSQLQKFHAPCAAGACVPLFLLLLLLLLLPIHLVPAYVEWGKMLKDTMKLTTVVTKKRFSQIT